ncbi:MAG TPA: MFS transporter [Anaerovoracaceae bacterium]|nr:MFS transporter [Anaerovoracaceae bacterium]
MEESKGRIKLAIYSFSILMMGVIAIAGGMGVLGAKFGPEGYDIAQLMAIPSIPIIIVTIVAGKLQEYVPIKVLVVIGILCFIVGGIAPAFVDSFSVILVLRAVFGVGVGLAQTLSSALVGMHFEGAERQKVMGIQTSAQMIGAAVMMFASGYLAKINWEAIFWVHILGVLSLIVVLICLPTNKPMRSAGGNVEKAVLTGAAVRWAATLTVFFICGMTLAQFLSIFMQEHGLGGPAESGNATMIFAIGGFLMGLFYGKLNSVAKNFTLTVGCFVGVVSYLIVAFSTGTAMAYIGSFVYGACVTIVVANIMTSTAMSVKPVAIPLAIALTTCGQNLGSYFCPLISRWGAELIGDDITMNVFIFGAIVFAVIGIVYIFLGAAETSKQKKATA